MRTAFHTACPYELAGKEATAQARRESRRGCKILERKPEGAKAVQLFLF